MAQRLWAASLCRVTPLCALEQPADEQFISELVSSQTFTAGLSQCTGLTLLTPAMSCLPQSLAAAGHVQASREMCCLFFQIFHKTFSYIPGGSKRVWIGRGSYRSSISTPPGVSACAPQSLWSLSPPGVTLPLSWCPRIPHAPSALWCDPGTSLCLLVQYGQ